MNLQWKPIADVHENPANPRVISDDAVKMVADSIKQFGWRQPVVATEAGMLLAGHVRVRAAISLGHLKVPVVVVDDDELTARQYLFADNKIHEWSAWDTGKLLSGFGEIMDLAGAETLSDIHLPGWGDEEIEKLAYYSTMMEEGLLGDGNTPSDEELPNFDPNEYVSLQYTIPRTKLEAVKKGIMSILALHGIDG